MITSGSELKDTIRYEEKIYFGEAGLTLEKRFRGGVRVKIFLCQRAARRYEYSCYRRDASGGIKSVYYAQKCKLLDRRLNRLCLLTGIEGIVGAGKGLNIYHPGVILNGEIGEDCVFHGQNVVGNKGMGRASEKPTIGSGVEFGAGAIAVGKINIADSCVVAAGAVVTKSFDVPGSVIAGVPARQLPKAD